MVLTIFILLFSSSAASAAVWWDGAELKPGQIGRLTVLKDTKLYKLEGENETFSRMLKAGEKYRIYAFKPGRLSVGGGYYVDRDSKVKYETPSKAKLEQVKKENYIDSEFASLAKKGQLKGVQGYVGITYGELKGLDGKGQVEQSEAYIIYGTKNAYYGFFYGNSYTSISSYQKVVIMSHTVSNKITAAQMEKYFGKPVARDTYKAGNYYVRFVEYSKGETDIHVGTKDGLNAWHTADEDGDLTIK